jgi:long-chain acyl-CoA synthetase
LVAESRTIYEIFVEAATRYDLETALAARRDGGWRSISHAEMRRRVRAISLGLDALGVTKGDRVAIVSESRPEWTLVDLGTLGCAAALVPIYPTLTADHVAFILEDSGAKVVFVSGREQWEKVEPLLVSLDAVVQVVAIDPEGIDDERVISLEELERRGGAIDDADPERAIKLASEGEPDDIATLIYTSGTTGRQKGVVLTNENFRSNIVASFDDTKLITDSDVAFSYLPLSHIFERTAVYGYVRLGVPIYFATSLETVAAEVREVRPTIMTSVPRLFEKMYAKICNSGRASGGLKRRVFDAAIGAGESCARAEHAGERVSPFSKLLYDLVAERVVYAKWRDALGGRLRFFISGGAPLAADVAYAFLAAKIPIYEGYGLTETSPVIAVNCESAYRVGTVGKPLQNLDVQIAEDGEILVKGPSVMRGYFNLPTESAEAFSDDGYFRTGDVGEIDADGYLKITDRKKDLIKTSGGKYVAPQPIENMIKASELVSQAIVIGDRRKFCSALIVPNFDALEPLCRQKGIETGDRAALIRDERVVEIYQQTVDGLTAHLSKYESIKRVALLPRELTVESGELTPTLKVKRRVVEERYREEIDRMYEEAERMGAPAHV